MLPTFILEKRSLLEMYANFMAHPDMFLSITMGATAEDRIVRFVEYYLTAFHEGRKGAVAKKPYNPILGETFHCSWDVPRDKVRPLARSNQGSAREPPRGPNNSQQGEDPQGGCYRVRFVAEQVSHHPPVSGFYCECRERRMCVNAHVWTKSKFMGMSIGVSMVGEGGGLTFPAVPVKISAATFYFFKILLSYRYIINSTLGSCQIKFIATTFFQIILRISLEF